MNLHLSILSLIFLFSLSLFAQKAPDFKVTTTDGNELNLYADYLNQGQSVVIELFFVTCPPCNTLAPYMADLHTKMKDAKVAVEFISFSDKGWDNDEEVKGFKAKYMHDWPFVSPNGGSLDAVKIYEDGTYGAFWGTPTTIVIAPDGTVDYNVRGSIGTDWTDNLEAAIIASQTAFNENNEPAMAIISGGINTTNGEGINGVNITFSGGKDTTITSNSDGTFETGSLLRDEKYTVTLEKTNDATNGVTTFDIVLISKNILGITPFTEAYQLIAADVNRSGAITAFDMVKVRQLILGITSEFSPVPSWLIDPNEITLESLNDLAALSFTGIKMGDVNGSADASNLLRTTDRNTQGNFSIIVKDRFVKKGELVAVDFSAKDLEATLGFQFTLNFDINSVQLIDYERIGINDFDKNNFNFNNKNRGLVSTSWFNNTPQKGEQLFTLRFKGKKDGYLSELLSINSKLTIAEAYSHDNELLNVDFTFEKEATLTSEKAILYPNPVANEGINVSFTLTKSSPILVNITDLKGSIISQQKYNLAEGQQQLNLPTAKLATGIYLVQLFQQEKLLEVLKFVKEE